MRYSVYLARKAILLIPVLLGVLTVLFAIDASLPPQERVAAYIEPSTAPRGPFIPCSGAAGQNGLLCPNPAYDRAAETVGLNAPVPVQWALFVYHALAGQWGHTTKAAFGTGDYGMGPSPQISGLLAWLVPYSAELLVMALLLTFPWVVTVGGALTQGKDRPTGRAASAASTSGVRVVSWSRSGRG